MRKVFKVVCVVLSMVYSMAVVASDHVALVVNDEVVTQSELNKAERHLKRGGAFSPSMDAQTIKKHIVDYVIDERLQLQQAKLQGLSVTENDLQKSLQNIASANGVTVSALLQSVQQSGMSLEDYRDVMKKQILIQKLATHHMTKPPKISEQEISYFLKKHRVLTQQSGSASPSAYHLHDYVLPQTSGLNQAKMVCERLSKKESLKNIPHEFQNLGMRAVSELPDAFVNAVKQLKINECSPPIQAENGIHVLKLVAIDVPNRSASVVLTREQAKQMVLEEKYNELMRNWVRELRSQSYIEMK